MDLLRKISFVFALLAFMNVAHSVELPPGLTLGNPSAPSGGTLKIRFSGEPYSLNPIISDGYQTVEIQFYVLEGLLLQNENTSQWQPWLADDWKVGEDGKSYEFHIRENAYWSDGKPVTSEDVKFSFDVLYDDKFPTAHMRPYYDGIKRVVALDRKRVRFETKEKYYGNFISSAGLPVVPKHFYGDAAKGPLIHRQILGSGPYVLEKWNEGRNIVLKKNPKWWGRADEIYAGKFKPQRVVFQFVADENVAFEMLKKGELDYMPLTAIQFEEATRLEKAGANFHTARIENSYPRSVSMIGFNMSRPLFQDRRLRLALAHLVDRDMMIEKFFYGATMKAKGPWYQQSEFADPRVEAIPFSPDRAFELLTEAGWKDEDGDGVLEKDLGNGLKTPLRFTLITANKQNERLLTVFKEDARQVGVDVQIKFLNQSAFGSVQQDGSFDAADLMASGGGLVEFNPKPQWHSKSLAPGGLNAVRYNEPRIDRLTERAVQIIDFKERVPVMREIYRKIAFDVPGIFLFNDRFDFYAYSNRVERTAPTYGYDVGTKFWWIKEGAKK